MNRLAPLLFVWVIAVAGSLVWLARYETSPSAAGTAVELWPHNPQIEIDRSVPTLLMFVHPKCPCTRASVGELSQLMTHCQGMVSAYVVLVEPPGVAAGWSNTDLGRSAGQIPGVQIIADKDAKLARAFHAETSGETFLYDTCCQIRFHGGITVSRGHRGENVGRWSIVGILTDDKHTDRLVETSVFGCPLHDSISNTKERS